MLAEMVWRAENAVRTWLRRRGVAVPHQSKEIE